MSRPMFDLGRAPRVLVVDDQAFMRTLVRGILEGDGYVVAEVTDGCHVTAALDAQPVDVVVMDVNMPILDGISATTAVRATRPLLPIVLITGSDDRSSRLAGTQAGANDFLGKPVDPTELLARVRTLCQAKGLYDTLERERRMLVQELEATRRAAVAAERLATLGTLTAGVGHEINNLASVALCLADNLEEGMEAEDIDVCRSVGEHLAGLGQQLMRMGRPSSSEASELDLEAVVRSTVALLQRAARLLRAQVHVVVTGEPRVVTVDRVELEQVVINLVGNAVDALEDCDDQQLWLGVEYEQRGAWLEVRDNGRGMSAEVADRVFEPYFTTKDADRGTGLGLSVVQHIAQAWGQDIELSSALGEGTSVRLWIPYGAPVDDRAVVAAWPGLAEGC